MNQLDDVTTFDATTSTTAEPVTSSINTRPVEPSGGSGILPLPGAERIRALRGDDAVFKAFDGYPWRKDAMFMVRNVLYRL